MQESNSDVCRLPFKRIAVTVPPAGWFHGIAGALFDLYRQGLLDLGLEVFDVPVDAFLPPDVVRISALVSGLRAFQPDFALGLSYGSYALLCGLPASRDGARPNLFTDVLDIPTICLWDHAPVELADQLTPNPSEPASSTSGAMETLRRVLTHPRLIHWSRDSGQTQIMKDLEFLLPNRLIEEMPPALPGFLHREKAGLHGDKVASVAFVGHLYQEPSNDPHPALGSLAGQVIETWSEDFQKPLWDVLERQVALLPTDLRHELALDRDQTFFWRFAHELIVHRAQTSLRLKMLGSAKVPVECYGNLRTDLAGVPHNLIPRPTDIPYGPELAALFARHPVTVDVLNPGFVNGYSHKQLHGFASGGFMLVNRKSDFVRAFGDAGEAVSYVDADDLRAKVDRYLGNPAYRREVGDAIRDRIASRFQLKHVLSRALHAAFECAKAMGSLPKSMKPTESGPSPVNAMDLLPKIRCEPQWTGASIRNSDRGALISTAPEAWAYAAAIGIPSSVNAMNEPHLRMTLRVEVGRIGLSPLIDETGALLKEQLVSPSADPVTVTVELPREGVSAVILRNTVDSASRAVVLEATLCDRLKSSSATR